MKKVMINTSKAIMLYVLVVLFLVFEMGVQVSPSIMTNQLMHDLHIGTFGLGLMSGLYFYTYAAMQIPSGLLYDIRMLKTKYLNMTNMTFLNNVMLTVLRSITLISNALIASFDFTKVSNASDCPWTTGGKGPMQKSEGFFIYVSDSERADQPPA